ncbi:MAG: hypothetical protein M1334_03765, partial [Patescibacteria group bacterium]|nr:hypothetical protein [Patescibacteria group bacterium]
AWQDCAVYCHTTTIILTFHSFECLGVGYHMDQDNWLTSKIIYINIKSAIKLKNQKEKLVKEEEKFSFLMIAVFVSVVIMAISVSIAMNNAPKQICRTRILSKEYLPGDPYPINEDKWRITFSIDGEKIILDVPRKQCDSCRVGDDIVVGYQQETVEDYRILSIMDLPLNACVYLGFNQTNCIK